MVVDGRGVSSADTGIPFFDHMLEQLGKHAGFDLSVKALGDLKVDAHHTVEDTGLAIGDALREVARRQGRHRAVRRRAGAARRGAAAGCASTCPARPYLVHEVDAKAKLIGTFDTRLAEEFIRAFAQAAGATIHVRMLAGKNPHHIVEAEFKALAQALRKACARTGRRGVPSTKGRL